MVGGVLGGGAIVCAILLVMVRAARILPARISDFELERRERSGEKRAADERKRSRFIVDLLSVQQVIVALLLVATTVLLLAAHGWLGGSILSVFVACLYGVVARQAWVHKHVQPLYHRIEPRLLAVFSRHQALFRFLRSVLPAPSRQVVASREELIHVLQAASVCTPNEKALLLNGLAFADRRVADVMTPRQDIDAVKHSEILGPLVLDDLHNTGHSSFPVIHGDLDHIVGVLALETVLQIDTTRKHTAKVETAMGTSVRYIDETKTLQQALGEFLSEKCHVIIVVNQENKTVGLLTLKDVLEALFGRTLTAKE